MINSLLDNDLYKLTMQQAVHALYPRAQARYLLINRGNTSFPKGFADSLRFEIDKLARLRLSSEENDFLENVCYFLTPVYLDFLKNYRFDPAEVRVQQNGEQLSVIVEGAWYRTILWEVPLMALISELYFLASRPLTLSRAQKTKRNVTKAIKMKEFGVEFADFGTRRRYSADNQNKVISDILSVEGNTLIGTSNVHFARKHNIKPIGTHAHEWFMFHAAVNGYRLANKMAIDAWTSVYNGNLGIALTDTYSSDAFLRVFDSVEARLFDGVRHDSGDPFSFVDKIVEHYQRLRIDPLTKTIVFSDGLNIDKAVELQKYCADKIKASFGIGTHLTNDIGPQPLNIVIKMEASRSSAELGWHPVIKLSDDSGKHTGDPDEIELCKRTLQRSLI